MCTYSYKHQTATALLASLFSKGPTKASLLWHNFICLPASWARLDWERELEKPGQEKEVVNEESVTGAWQRDCSPHNSVPH